MHSLFWWILPLDVVHSDFCSRCYLTWNKRRKKLFSRQMLLLQKGSVQSAGLILPCWTAWVFTALTWLTGFQSVCNTGKGVVWSSCKDFYTVETFCNSSNHLSISSLEVAYFSTWGCMRWVLLSFVKSSFGAENRPYECSHRAKAETCSIRSFFAWYALGSQ